MSRAEVGQQASRRTQMRMLVARWRKSGQAAERFAREQGVNPKSFHYWKRKFGGDGVGSVASSRVLATEPTSRVRPGPTFAEVLLKPAGRAVQEAAAARRGRVAGAVIEIELANGDRIRVEGLTTPGPVLAEILAALGRRASC